MNTIKTSIATLIGLSLNGFSGAALAGFNAAVNYTVSSPPTTVQIADVNRDGKPDLVSFGLGGFYGAGVISVLLGNGDGTFNPRTDYPYPFEDSAHAWLKIGDLNRDGKLDLVASDTEHRNGLDDLTYDVSVFLGNGDGTFNPGTTYPAGFMSSNVEIGDVNRDGKPDLVVAYKDGANVLLGNGDGTFNPKTDYSTLSNTGWVQVGDVNRDGKTDLVTTDGTGYASVLLGNGDGTFNPKTDYLFEGFHDLQIDDVNRDGKPDLVGGDADSYLHVLLGNGDGTFNPQTSYFVGNGSGYGSVPRSVKIGDINRDGKPDLVTALMHLDTVSVLLGNGDGTFNPKTDYSFPGISYPEDIQIGDVNRDGKPDLVTANTGNHTVSVLLGN
jgi:hypothetical protein